MFIPSSLGMVLPRALLDPIDESIWQPSIVPADPPYVDTAVGFNVGCLFTVTVIGDIHSLCYCRVTGMAASGTMQLWDISGGTDTLLAQKAYSGHSGTGWRAIPLDAPIRSDPAKAYVVSMWVPSSAGTFVTARTPGYFVNRGFYSEHSFLYASVSNGQDDPRGFTKRNGLFKVGASPARPDQFFAHDNFWVDVIINARPKAEPPLPPVVLKWPIPDGYPNLDNTGPDPDTVFTTEPENIVSIADGQVIEDLDVRGSISIQHNNVTVRNCKTTSIEGYGIFIAPGTDGATIEHCLVDKTGRRNEGSTGIGIGGTNVTIRYNDVMRSENGIAPFGGIGPTLIEHNFVHNLRASPGHPHYDGIQCDGLNDDLTILHNTIFNENGDTACIMIDNIAGGSDGILVENNYLAGAGFTCYCDARFAAPANPLTNVAYRGNILRPGSYGYFSIQAATPELAGNQFIEHGSIFDAPPAGGFTPGQTVPECFFGLASPSGSIVGETVPSGTGVTLGLSFTPLKDGTITGLNFYKPGASRSTSFTIGLWRWLGPNKTGGVEFLASSLIENVGRAGQWVGFAFDAPIAVTALDNLLIGVFIPRGSDGKCWYGAGNGSFPSDVPSQWGNLLAFNNTGAVVNGFVGCNGMYAYGTDILAPIQAGASGSNYYVDPVFSAVWS